MIQKNKVISRHDIKLVAHNAVRFNNSVDMQKSNRSYYVRSEGRIDTFRRKKIKKHQKNY